MSYRVNREKNDQNNSIVPIRTADSNKRSDLIFVSAGEEA